MRNKCQTQLKPRPASAAGQSAYRNGGILLIYKNKFTVTSPKMVTVYDKEYSDEKISDDGRYLNSKFYKGTVSGAARDAEFEKTLFKDERIESRFQSAVFSDVIFVDCDISNAVFSDCAFMNSEFDRCRMTGADFSGNMFRDVKIKGCKCDLTGFRFCKFNRVAFGGSICADSDFEGSEFLKIKFCHTDLTHAQMSGIPLMGIDLSDCKIDGLGADVKNLAGVIISPVQSLTVAKIAGAVIRDA